MGRSLRCNWDAFWSAALKDHCHAGLIWNERTRSELREALQVWISSSMHSASEHAHTLSHHQKHFCIACSHSMQVLLCLALPQCQVAEQPCLGKGLHTGQVAIQRVPKYTTLTPHPCTCLRGESRCSCFDSVTRRH